VDVLPGSVRHRLLMLVLHGGVGDPHHSVVGVSPVGSQAGNARLITRSEEIGCPVAALQLDRDCDQLRRDRLVDSDSVPALVLRLGAKPQRQLALGRFWRITGVNQVLLHR